MLASPLRTQKNKCIIVCSLPAPLSRRLIIVVLVVCQYIHPYRIFELCPMELTEHQFYAYPVTIALTRTVLAGHLTVSPQAGPLSLHLLAWFTCRAPESTQCL